MKTQLVRLVTLVMILLTLQITFAPSVSQAVSVCECETEKPKGCGAMCLVAVVIAIVGGVCIWGLKKMCKKLLPPPTPPPPPPSPPQQPTNTNRTATATLKMSQMSQLIANQQQIDGLCDNDGNGIATYDVWSYGFTDPIANTPYRLLSVTTLQTSTNLLQWDDACTVVSWTSMVPQQSTNCLTVWYYGRVGFDTNGVWQGGIPFYTNYIHRYDGTESITSPTNVVGDGPVKFLRLSAIQ